MDIGPEARLPGCICVVLYILKGILSTIWEELGAETLISAEVQVVLHAIHAESNRR